MRIYNEQPLFPLEVNVFFKLVVTVIECCDGCSCFGSCGGCPFSNCFVGVLITVVVRAFVGVLGLRLYALGAVAVLPIVGVVIGVLLWPFAGVLGLWELVAVVALLECFGPSRSCSRGGPCDCFGPLGGYCPSGEYPFWSLRRFDVCGWYVCCDVML